jgi:hypothetical protein
LLSRLVSNSNDEIGSIDFPFFPKEPEYLSVTGAGNETRTRDLNLGKVALYQLSYSRRLLKNYLEKYSSSFNYQKKFGDIFERLERETRLELATSTLARLRSTN